MQGKDQRDSERRVSWGTRHRSSLVDDKKFMRHVRGA